MQEIDPSDPIYKGMTKRELAQLKWLSLAQKEELSLRLFGESLFGPPSWEKQRESRWMALLNDGASSRKPYRVTHEDLLRRIAFDARRRAHRSDASFDKRSLTVSAFSDWVLRFYVPEKNPFALLMGTKGEQAVVNQRERIRRAKLEIPRWEYQGWKLIHDGIRRRFDQGFEIPSLRINNTPLRGIPDLVFRERRSRRILIIELKVSGADLPDEGWPNLRAQLWAYSRIQQWCAAPEMILAGEIWSPEAAGLLRRHTYRWLKGNAELETQSIELFQAYGGEVVQ